MKVRKIINNFSGVIKFSHFFVVGFLRIESLHSFLHRKRNYSKYAKIPLLLHRYLELKTDEEKLEFIDTKFKDINKDLYEYSWKEISKIKTSNESIDNKKYDQYETYIDKLNNLLNHEYGIKDEKFFSSVGIVNKKTDVSEDYNDNEMNIIKSLDSFFDSFKKISKRILRYENSSKEKINISLEDLKICILIISVEFSSFLHHIYVAYHKNIKKTENIKKALNHLKRAKSDAEKAFLLSTDYFSYPTIKQRLKEIDEVGM